MHIGFVKAQKQKKNKTIIVHHNFENTKVGRQMK